MQITASAQVGGLAQAHCTHVRLHAYATQLHARVASACTCVRPAHHAFLADRTVDDMINDVVVQLLQRKLLVACDRKFKKPKPGKTKLVKWPRTLESLRVSMQ